MRTIHGLMLAGALLITGCAAEEEPAGPPIDMRHTTRDLMAGMIDASADALWDAVGTIWDENGENYWEPETDESGNLLMLGNRARDTDQWYAYSQDMIDAAAVALEAARARDADRIFDSGEVVYNACNNCHNIYWIGDEQRGRTIR